METLTNINVLTLDPLPTPNEVRRQLPLDDAKSRVVAEGRASIANILDHRDPRLFVVVGPCSIHDLKAAREYADRLLALNEKVADQILPVMRVYFEKPRTATGWKGFINDPRLDDSFHIEEGVFKARELLLELAGKGLLTGTEALDPIMPQYLGDLISWNAIGARTTESQTHREMASGLSTPVGFKNGTDGSIDVAVNAMKSAASGHSFLGITMDGQSAVVRTRGNPYAHLVLRGGPEPNYDSESLALAAAQLRSAGLREALVVDCSHANSRKKPELQPLVMEHCITQVVEGNRNLVGLMVESHLEAGNQALPQDLNQLRYGVSITDGCIDWETTETMLTTAAERLRTAR